MVKCSRTNSYCKMCQYRRTSLGISLMWYKIIYVIVVIVICVLCPVRLDDTIDMSSDIARLRKDILPTQYRATRLVRPVVSESTSMTLTVTVKISDFISFELDKSNWGCETYKIFVGVVLCTLLRLSMRACTLL